MIDLAEDSRKKVERALLVGIREPGQTEAEISECLDELADLVRNLDIVPLEPVVVSLHQVMPQYYVGSGKAQEIYAALRARGVLVRHFEKPRIAAYNRITVGTPAENDALLAALRDFLDA